MTNRPQFIDLDAIPHPSDYVHRFGFPLDSPYLERCFAPLVGPSSVLVLRHCMALWRDAMPAQVPAEDLARQLGLGKGTGANSPLWRTLERVVGFRLAKMDNPGQLEVFTEIAPLAARQLERLPAWSRAQHDHLLGRHLDGLARPHARSLTAADQTPAPTVAIANDVPARVRMAQHLERLSLAAAHSAPSRRR